MQKSLFLIKSLGECDSFFIKKCIADKSVRIAGKTTNNAGNGKTTTSLIKAPESLINHQTSLIEGCPSLHKKLNK